MELLVRRLHLVEGTPTKPCASTLRISSGLNAMTHSKALTLKDLEEASKKLAAVADFGPRLRWWLLGGHSAERWIQFEWAFRLHQLLESKFAVLCEIDRVDISIVDACTKPEPLWKKDPGAKIELKFWGNWWVKAKQRADLKTDLEKINGYEVPAVAVVLFPMVEKGSLPGHEWIREQIEARSGVKDIPGLLKKLQQEPDKIYETAVDCGHESPSAKLYTLVFCNKEMPST